MDSSSSLSSEDFTPKILWCGLARDETILAEAHVDDGDDVLQTARELLIKKPTPGFEFHAPNRWKLRKNQRNLKGIKFHLYEHEGKGKDDFAAPSLRIWVFAAVYDSELITRSEVQSFIEKIVTISDNMRQDETWKTCGNLGLQGSFAPILQQRLEDVAYWGKMALIEDQLHACQEQMEKNITLILERGEKIEDLSQEATRVQEMASVFKKSAKKVRRMQMMKNAKHGIILGTAVTAGVAVCVIPPLVGIL
jgi:hypothetical protein